MESHLGPPVLVSLTASTPQREWALFRRSSRPSLSPHCPPWAPGSCPPPGGRDGLLSSRTHHVCLDGPYVLLDLVSLSAASVLMLMGKSPKSVDPRL